MVVVRYLILCSKFAKNRLSAGLRLDLLGGAYVAPPDPLAGSWGKGGKREMEGQERTGRRGGKGSGMGRKGYTIRMKILATALGMFYRC